jgi:hypothetical protein
VIAPDPLDVASELAERERAAMIKVRKPEAVRTGYCLNERCGDALDNPAAAFCGLPCSEAAQRAATALRRR